MPEILTHSHDLKSLSSHDNHQVYNGLDCCITLEVFHQIEPLLEPESQVIYNFERAMQAPALEMMLRGFRVDQYQRGIWVNKLKTRQTTIQEILDEFTSAIWLRGLNPRSVKQKREFFYEAMGLPAQYKYVKGEKKISVDREALEKLLSYFYAQPIINCILALQDLSKKISVLETEVDSDSRMRTSYNVAGTETGRWSSSRNIDGGGTNLQNITEELRRIFIADTGKKIAYIDLSQAESRAVGWLCWILFGKSGYLDACESGDLHTSVAKLVWSRMNWSGDASLDKEKAEQPFYRHFSYRDMAKRGGHGTNYYGTAYTMARHLKVAVKLIEEFQANYFKAFPEIKEYHRWIAKQLQLHGRVSTPLGTGRVFFGRLNDDATLREAIAYVPQHMVGVLLNLALWRVWYYLGREVEILGQLHDAIIIQYPEDQEDSIIPKVLPLMATPLHHKDRSMTIPSDVLTGWNWAKFYDEKMAEKDRKLGKKPKALNLDGLKSWSGNDGRKRREPPGGMGRDRIIS